MLSTRLAVLDWMRDNGQLDGLDEIQNTAIGGGANRGEAR